MNDTLPDELSNLIGAFGRASDVFGYMEDQGTDGEVREARAVRDAARASLVSAILDYARDERERQREACAKHVEGQMYGAIGGVAAHFVRTTPPSSAPPSPGGEEPGCGMCGPDGNGLHCNRHFNGEHQALAYKMVRTGEVAQRWPILPAPSRSERTEDAGGWCPNTTLRIPQGDCGCCGVETVTGVCDMPAGHEGEHDDRPLYPAPAAPQTTPERIPGFNEAMLPPGWVEREMARRAAPQTTPAPEGTTEEETCRCGQFLMAPGEDAWDAGVLHTTETCNPCAWGSRRHSTEGAAAPGKEDASHE